MSKRRRNKKIRSHVKRLLYEQERNPVGKREFNYRMRIARRKDFRRIFLRIVLIIVIVLAALFAAANVICYRNTGESLFGVQRDARKIVEKSTADDFKMAATSYVYSDDGTKLAELSADSDGTYLSYDEIPKNVVNAFVAVEDRTFWTNNGTDLKGIARVVINYIRSNGQNEAGASTITQQLARTQFLTREKTISRKIREIFIARELTKKYSKEQIMEFYVNTCCFANGIYGIEDASQQYFEKSADKLDLSQTAYLCAIPNRPEYYNPYYDSTNAITRRNKILQNMEDCNFISASDYNKAVKEKITVKRSTKDTESYNYETTYAVNCATRYLMKLDGFDFKYKFSSTKEFNSYLKSYNTAYEDARHDLYTRGYKITTSIDLDAQKKMQKAVNDRLDFSTAKGSDGIYELQGAATAIDNETGKVIAIIGGREQEESDSTYSLNRAFQSYRQPGSSFKPLAVYTPALENGYTKYSILKNIDVSVAKNLHSSSEINNLSGESMTMNQAVINSENGCAYWLFNKIHPSTGLSYVTKMQFSRIVSSDYTLSAALGGLTYGVTTVEMANAYSTLENHGEYTQTDCITRIEDADGNNIYEAPSGKRVYTQTAADTMTDIMKGVVTQGTAASMDWYDSSSTQAAGKTGTTNGSKDGWFCGFTPYYTIAVWVGYDTPQTLSSLYGSSYPAQIWKECMLGLIEGKDTAEFDLTTTEGSSDSSNDSDSGSSGYDYDNDTTDQDTDTGNTDTYDNGNGDTGDTGTEDYGGNTGDNGDTGNGDTGNGDTGNNGETDNGGDTGNNGGTDTGGNNGNNTGGGDTGGGDDDTGNADTGGL